MSKNQTFTLFVVLLLALNVIAAPLNCSWKSPTGNFYDFASLKKDGGYQIKDSNNNMDMFDLIYVTNICETVTCSNQEVSLYEGLEILGEITLNCDILTNANPPVFSFINPDSPTLGVQFQYIGEQCIVPPTISFDENNQLITTPNKQNEIRTSTFQIFCADDQASSFTLDSSDPCHPIFKMTSPQGCVGAADISYTSLKILLFLIVIVSAYFIGGSQMNNRKYGLTGIESIPHHSFWTDFPSLIQDGLRFSLLQATSVIRHFQAKSEAITNSSSGATYNTI